jgi:hypothetical protein
MQDQEWRGMGRCSGRGVVHGCSWGEVWRLRLRTNRARTLATFLPANSSVLGGNFWKFIERKLKGDLWR